MDFGIVGRHMVACIASVLSMLDTRLLRPLDPAPSTNSHTLSSQLMQHISSLGHLESKGGEPVGFQDSRDVSFIL